MTKQFLTFTHDGRVRPTHYDNGTPVLNFTLGEFQQLGTQINVSTPLTTSDDARLFVYALASADLQWHFDDDIEDNMFPDLTATQRTQLGHRQAELFTLLSDPHDEAIDAMYMSHKVFEDLGKVRA